MLTWAEARQGAPEREGLSLVERVVALREELVDALELAAGWKTMTMAWMGIVVWRFAYQLAELDQAREELTAWQAHAGDALAALMVSAEQRLDLELQLGAARAALPALEAAVARGRREDVARALEPLRRALAGGGSR